MEMYRPTLHSNLWLGLMTIAFLALYYWSESSHVTVRATDYSEKIDASETMVNALNTLQDYRLPGLATESVDDIQDPLAYVMLGEKDSPITTDEGRIQDKITVLNPNFSAIIVDVFNKAGLKAGDDIAIMITGSMPGANLAVYSAAKALKLNPVIITSVGSSWWGANDPDFTWLDMERVLYENGIFNFYSGAATAGGSDDQGGLRLSAIGLQLIADAIKRNEVVYIREGSLSSNIQGRLEYFKRINPIKDYKAVINVGGGVAAIGHPINSKLIPDGFNSGLPDKNYPNLGVVHYFSRENVPVIHIYDVERLAKKYDLPVGLWPLPKERDGSIRIGYGTVFEYTKYNLLTAWVALGLMFVILVIVKYFDRQRFKWREEQRSADGDL